MSADRLRKVAAEMRELAEAATPGPWFAIPNDETFNPSVGTVPATYPSRLETEMWVAEAGPGRADDAIHIAAWSPLVALEAAELLDELSGLAGAIADYREGFITPPEGVVRIVDRALALCDAWEAGR